MSRVARIVVPGIPHHITQRGNRQAAIFETDEDRLAYLRFLKKYTVQHDLSLWAYCLMTNHVHLVAVPGHEASLDTPCATPTRYTPCTSTVAPHVPVTCGRGVSTPVPWTIRICGRRCVMWSATRWRRGWWNGQKPIAGRVPGPIAGFVPTNC